MSWFRNSKAATTPDYTGLQLQTSVNTLPIPIVWGQTKAAANIVWYQNFQTHGGGTNGKPRKLARLLNRDWHVACVWSQPA